MLFHLKYKSPYLIFLFLSEIYLNWVLHNWVQTELEYRHHGICSACVEKGWNCEGRINCIIFSSYTWICILKWKAFVWRQKKGYLHNINIGLRDYPHYISYCKLQYISLELKSSAFSRIKTKFLHLYHVHMFKAPMH